MKDQMPPHGEQVQTNIKCARCGEVVKSNEAHICKEDRKDENSEEN